MKYQYGCNFISTYGKQINVLMGFDDDLTLGGVNALQAAGIRKPTAVGYPRGSCNLRVERLMHLLCQSTLYAPLWAIGLNLIDKTGL